MGNKEGNTVLKNSVQPSITQFLNKVLFLKSSITKMSVKAIKMLFFGFFFIFSLSSAIIILVMLFMVNKVYEKVKRYIKENYKFLLTIVLLFVFFFYELPFVVYKPGGTIDLSDRVEIEDMYPSEGSLSMAYVSMMKGNIPFVLLSFVIPNWDLVPQSKITLENESVDDSIIRDRLFLEEGLDNATISAYHLANKEIKIKKINHVVTYITEEAKTNLKVGDVILNVDGKEFSALEELQGYINSLEKNREVSFLVLRDDKEKKCTAHVYEIEQVLKVGISIINKYEYEENPKINIKTKASESGSSGGLMTSLSIYNALVSEDITKGRNIVGTGTIDIYGNVGEIGGVKYKLLGAEKAGADIFLCPVLNYEEALQVLEENHLKLKLISVDTLENAVKELQK